MDSQDIDESAGKKKRRTDGERAGKPLPNLLNALGRLAVGDTMT
jgi:hypothetical protein